MSDDGRQVITTVHPDPLAQISYKAISLVNKQTMCNTRKRLLCVMQAMKPHTSMQPDLDLDLHCSHQGLFRIICTTITKTCLYNFDPLEPHFYIEKLGFTGVYIILLIFAQDIDCRYSLEPPHRGGSNEYPRSMS